MELVSEPKIHGTIYHRRNMEPLVEFSPCNGSEILSVIMNQVSNSITFLHRTDDLLQFSTLTYDVSIYLFLRGGGGNDVNNDSKFNDIPALTKIGFQWNGLPCIDFDEKVLFMFNACSMLDLDPFRRMVTLFSTLLEELMLEEYLVLHREPLPQHRLLPVVTNATNGLLPAY